MMRPSNNLVIPYVLGSERQNETPSVTMNQIISLRQGFVDPDDSANENPTSPNNEEDDSERGPLVVGQVVSTDERQVLIVQDVISSIIGDTPPIYAPMSVAFITVQSSELNEEVQVHRTKNRKHRITVISIFVLSVLLLLTFVTVTFSVRKISIYTVWFNLIPLAMFFINSGFLRSSDILVRAVSILSFVIGILMIVIGVIAILAFAVYLATVTKK